ncbi:MAG: hypothetical protein ACI4PW_09975, partial [Alphaproteobacteria bacterium]
IKKAEILNFSVGSDTAFNFFCAQDSFNFFEAERKTPFPPFDLLRDSPFNFAQMLKSFCILITRHFSDCFVL